MIPEKRWRLVSPDTEAAHTLARKLGISPIAGRVLLNRGIADVNDARAFLNPELHHLHDPSALPALDAAAQRIRHAIRDDEPMVIYGDYDVDGVSATAILLRCIALAGGKATYYIPDRVEEGYGLNADAVRALAENGARLIITVDCGITAVAEIALARELGMDVIVTDHHLPDDEIPADAILVNPKLPGCPYPFHDLSGSGLAFKLAWAVGKAFSETTRVSSAFRDFLVDAVSLAALGTIADVVPLHGENRALAYFGLKGLSASEAHGMRALREVSRLTDHDLTATDIAFRLAPRLNAAGRMGSARHAVELLVTDNPDRAADIAEHLGKENSRRQRLQERILSEAYEQLSSRGGLDHTWSIVLASESWHAGVLGIVASRLTEEFRRPAILLTLDGDTAHGSARAMAPLNLFNLLRNCSGHLVGYGGHAFAAGLRLEARNLDAFRADFETQSAQCLESADLTPEIAIDAEVTLDNISRRLVDDLSRLAPFGEGNAEPVIVCRNVTLPSGVRRMGTGGKHLSFWAKQNGAAFRAVAFGMGDCAEAIERRGACSIAFVPRLNRWRGQETVELDVRDIQLS